ncbi:MAG: cytochrome c3 family protein [Bacillota bacterium]|nr:cytochrome c3 family protein [Bacillota bacterium]
MLGALVLLVATGALTWAASAELKAGKVRFTPHGDPATNPRGCLTCHSVHGGSPDSRLMFREGGDQEAMPLCITCHGERSSPPGFPGPLVYRQFSAHSNSITGAQWAGTQFLPGDCLNCHSIHFPETTQGLLRKDNADNGLCLACHGKGRRPWGRWPGKEAYNVSAHFAAPLAEGVRRSDPSRPAFPGQCVNCHNPHGWEDQVGGGFPEKLLWTREPELCFLCHEEQREEFTQVGIDSRHKVDWPEQGISCSDCHNPHLVWPAATGSLVSDPDRPNELLAFPEWAYSVRTRAFDDFCLRCHDGTWPNAVDIRREISELNPPPGGYAGRFSWFRYPGSSGSNLHYLHVIGFGYGCPNCHNAHSSTGTSGINRGRNLPSWIRVNEFIEGYRNMDSCGGGLPGFVCH